MSEAYDKGYDQGYDDAINGEPNAVDRGTVAEILDRLLFGWTDLLDDSVSEFEEGYREGYRDGEAEREEE